MSQLINGFYISLKCYTLLSVDFLLYLRYDLPYNSPELDLLNKSFKWINPASIIFVLWFLYDPAAEFILVIIFSILFGGIIILAFLYISHYDEVNRNIFAFLNNFIHSSYYIVRFGFILTLTVAFIPFMVYNFYFVFLYLCANYLTLLLLKFYDNCSIVDTQQANETIDWFNQISNIINHLFYSFTTTSPLNKTDVYNYISFVCLKLIDYLEIFIEYFEADNFIYSLCLIIIFPFFFLYDLLFDDQYFHKVFNNRVTTTCTKLSTVVEDPEIATFFECLVFIVQYLRLSFIVVIILTCLDFLLNLGFIIRAIYWLESSYKILSQFPHNFYLTLRNNIEGRTIQGEGFIMYEYSNSTLEYDFSPTYIEPDLGTANTEASEITETTYILGPDFVMLGIPYFSDSKVSSFVDFSGSFTSTDIKGPDFIMLGTPYFSDSKVSSFVDFSGRFTSTDLKGPDFVMVGPPYLSNSKISLASNFGRVSQVRHFSYSSRLSNSLQVSTTTNNNWSIITYYTNSGTIILTSELFSSLIQEFYSHLSPDNTAFIIKVEYQDGSTRSLMPIQIINRNFDQDEIIGIINFHLNIKAEWYKLNAVHNVSLMYKATSDIVRLTRPLDMTPASNDSINDLQYLPFIPQSYELFTWGNIVKSILDSKYTIISFDKLFKYEVNVHQNFYSVNVYTLATSKPNRNSSYKHLADFNIFSLDSSNLSHLNIFLTLHNDEFTFEVNNGQLVKGEMPYNLKFMSRLYPMAKGESWNSNKIITFDLETRTINNVLTPYAIGFYDGESSNSFYLSDFEDVDHMILTALSSIILDRYNGWYVYAHNLSGFDSIFIIKYLVQLAHNNELNPIMRQGKLISLNFNFVVDSQESTQPQLCTLHFLDSINLMGSSLRKLGQSFNVDVQKDVFPYRFSDIAPLDYIGPVPDYSYFETKDLFLSDYQSYVQRFDNNWSMRHVCLQYMQDDCVSLYQIIQSYGTLICNDYRVDITTTPTAPSLSMKIYRTCFMQSTKIGLIDGQLYNILKLGYYGGIVDAYIPYGEDLSYNDVNSLYPQGIKPPIPVGNPVHVIGNIDLDNFFGMIKAHIVCPADLDVPVLPVKLNGRLIAPTGEWTGWYVSEELRDVRDNSGYTITPIEGYRFDKEQIFPEYVDHFYNLKLLAKGNEAKGIEPDPARYSISKNNLNSLYGRFGMSPIIEETTICPSTNSFANKVITDVQILAGEVDILTSQEVGVNLNINVAVSAFVTAYSRIHMNHIKRLPGYLIYYSDTDSLVTNKPLPEYIYGVNLGQIKLEHHVIKGLFIGPKMYAIITPEKTIIKIRGLRGRDIKFGFDNMLSLLRENITTTQNLMLRDIKQGIISIREQVFTLMATNNKRVIIRDSQGKFIATRPYRLINDVLISSTFELIPSTALVPYKSRNLSLLTSISQSQVMTSTEFNIMIYYLHNIRYVEFILRSDPSMASILNGTQNFVLLPNFGLVIYDPRNFALSIYEPHNLH